MSVANIVRSSLGPQGLDKMIVDDVGEVTITNDGATILKKLEVEHPTANLLVQLAQLQDSEVGDGTTSVVILAAELLKRAQELVKMKVHPTNIISGYKIAAREACRYIEDKLAISVETLGEEALANCAKTSMSSKIINADPKFFANLVVDAIKTIRQDSILGPKYPIKSINSQGPWSKFNRKSIGQGIRSANRQSSPADAYCCEERQNCLPRFQFE